MAIMPDGHMGTMMPDAKMGVEMMKMAKPIKHCMIMMTDAKGKAFMIDASTKRAMVRIGPLKTHVPAEHIADSIFRLANETSLPRPLPWQWEPYLCGKPAEKLA
ncbi:hypothetical protein MesoLj113c_44240 [Mesorhizobium sp. 113-3-9]|uniref:hypothetical protein n=1 Tax=Mesorhizobium sp. 113-3-9 TaxID=2744517 RepID=UPI001935C78C|nr:hypothetical protein [Mesorhizobium sp. 113-3-9]BCG88314.1 hypothetical protein MesoLj113c_44240 [Mesorhizobium sp. 113-3-9]